MVIMFVYNGKCKKCKVEYSKLLLPLPQRTEVVVTPCMFCGELVDLKCSGEE